jgi:hypothetical protein
VRHSCFDIKAEQSDAQAFLLCSSPQVENVVKMKEEIDYKTLHKKVQAELDNMTAHFERREQEMELREAQVRGKPRLASQTIGLHPDCDFRKWHVDEVLIHARAER